MPHLRPVYFYGAQQEGTGHLSQFYWAPFADESGTVYATAEMYMMVHKARLFGDDSAAAQMLATTEPRRHKALGRAVGGFDEAVWDEHKVAIVTQGNVLKFTVSEDAETLRALLLATGERELVEAAPRDRVWGIGFGESEAEGNRGRWGQNLLGKVLMEVRARLREGGVM